MKKLIGRWDPQKPLYFEAADIPLINNIVRAWYLGKWAALTAGEMSALNIKGFDAGAEHVLSAEAYREALAWKTVGAHPPGAKQPGFGSWQEASQ